MKLLVLGGTVFLGRHIVEAAMARGHEVTLFNRGQQNAGLFSNVEKLYGDRDGNLDSLRGRQWDAVIDTSGYVPRVVRQSAELLQEAADHYTFISSISVYADFSQTDIDELALMGKLEDESREDVREFYGPLKARCEQVVQTLFPDKALVIRPGLIVGPYDPTDRFTYWPHRFAKGGEVLAPGNKAQSVQMIDARDLAEWTVTLVEQNITGVFNATGPSEQLTMVDFLETCKQEVGTNALITWVDECFLHDKGVSEWSDLPLWISEKMNWPGFLNVDISKAMAHGLQFRPLAHTIRDTLAWSQTRRAHVWKAGLKPEQEAQLLKEWHAENDLNARN